MRRPPTALLAVGLLTLALPLAGCAFTPAQKARQQQEQSQENARKQLNETERQRLKKEIGRLDHVTKVDFGYTDTWPEKGVASVTIYLPLADRDERTSDLTFDQVTKSVWTSRLRPLDEITICLCWRDSNNHGDEEELTPLLGDTGRPELARRYGPRPTGTTSPTS